MKSVIIIHLLMICLRTRGNGMMSNKTMSFLSYVNEDLSWKELASVCMQRDLVMTFALRYTKEEKTTPKFVFYSDEQWQRLFEIHALDIVRERDCILNPSQCIGSWELNEENLYRMSERLHLKGSSLMMKTYDKLRSYDTCAEVRDHLLSNLHPTQIIDLQGPACKDGGLAWGTWTRECYGSIYPQKDILIPGMDLLQSWYGYEELKGGNRLAKKWNPNTWHIALLNCPNPGAIKMNYNITFHYFRMHHIYGIESTFPKLKRNCPEIQRRKYNSSAYKNNISFQLVISVLLLTMLNL